MPPAEILFQENCSLKEENQALKDESAVLRAKIGWLQQQLFGGGQSEKLDRAQLQLKLGELEKLAAAKEKKTTVTYERVQPAPEKRKLPAENFARLPIKETIVIEPPEVLAEPEAYERIGEERTFEVDLVQPELFKREIVRPKYRRKADKSQAPVVAAAPARPVAGGYASAGLLAWVALSKYVDHLPLYRLEQMSTRWGAPLSRQSMADWIRIASEWLEPIYRAMHRGLLASGYVQADETPVKCNDPDEKRGGTSQGYLWVLSRPGGDVVFDWRLSRRHGELTNLLTDNYQGILQSDGYEAYARYVEDHPGVVWAACWAHARRKWFEAQAGDPKAVRVALRLIARLYRLEREWDEQGVTPLERARLRTSGFARSLKWLRSLALRLRERALPRSLLGKASGYLLGHWEPLTTHLRHGETKLDTNVVENAIRPSAIGKKNWMFIGHPDAGQRSAIIYSIVVSCQRHGKDPLAYLRDVLARLPAMTNQDDLAPLLPVNWQPS
jgi:transposase